MKYDHWLKAEKVCVIGAGTMGGGIAAHLANIGFEVTLLDQTLESAEAGLERAKLARPPTFFVPHKADSIRLGSTEENLEWVSEADWVCEAIVEHLDAKKALFELIDPLLGAEAMITTNTSGLQIGLLAEGRSNSFRSRFMGTHFFNPPRYLKLLELIPTQDSAPEAVKSMTRFLEDRVARRVVPAKDTPGFIANRFGMWAMFNAIHATERLRLCVEDADLITGAFLGRPRSASFRLNDIVGLDVMLDIARNLMQRCPDDPHIGTLQTPQSMLGLISRGWIGDKAGQGYYKKEGKELVVYDLQTAAYRMKREGSFPSLNELGKLPLGERVAQALELKDEVGEFLRLHIVPVLKYADYLKEEISHSVLDFDRVMQWGFGWEMGPFGMIDAIGRDKLGITGGPFYQDHKIQEFDGRYVSIPKQPEYKPLCEYPVSDERSFFRVRDLGDNVVALCLTTKMGVISPPLIAELSKYFDTAKFERFVLTSEGRSFSAGFDLNFFAEKITQEDWNGIEEAIEDLQDLAERMASKPGAAAIYGHCLGAGYELACRCSVIVANAECQIGLPESKVGLIPGGGGTAIMRLRNQHLGAKGLTETLGRLLSGAVSANADEARHLGYLRPTDHTSYHPDRLIHDAKEAVLKAEVREEESLVPLTGPLPGMIDNLLAQRRQKGEFTDFDEQIGLKLKTVFSKSTSFNDALSRERQMFLDLCGRSMTLLRIKHMIENGKPLRN